LNGARLRLINIGAHDWRNSIADHFTGRSQRIVVKMGIALCCCAVAWPSKAPIIGNRAPIETTMLAKL
jgi:hypothetical protein